MRLPEKFLSRMKDLLSDEYDAFLSSYEDERHYGLRVNTLRVGVEDFLKISPFGLEPVSWTKDGFYYYSRGEKGSAAQGRSDIKEVEPPGKHPYYHAGLYYIQEPSAMVPGVIMDAKPGEKILDLCAAPGGKTVQMAAGLKGQGVLVANDIHPNRVKALVKNIELYGAKNAVVTNETPQRLSEKFAGYFDKILIDAPCSGEGMMRKDEQAARSWEKFDVETCCGMQRDILQYADRMLKVGGTLCYSTCTFSPEENEGTLDWFLNKFSNYKVLKAGEGLNLEPGRPEWIGAHESLNGSVRVWPHKVKGEGHFAAVLQKDDLRKPVSSIYLPQAVDKDAAKLWAEFVHRQFLNAPEGLLQGYGESLYYIPEGLPDLRGLNIVRTGVQLGTIRNGRFEPSQALAMAYPMNAHKNTVNLSLQSHDVIRYLKGETLTVSDEGKGWVIVGVEGFPLGWGKKDNGILKNGYPKAWRKM